MGVIDEISSSDTVALDTNIFIYAYQKSNPQAQAAIALLEKVKTIGFRCFISVLVLEEFLVGVYKRGLEKDINYYEDFLTSGGLITVVDMDRQIARSAAKLRAEYPSLRAPDAIHLASAIFVGANTFITTDRRMSKRIKSLKVKVLTN